MSRIVIEITPMLNARLRQYILAVSPDKQRGMLKKIVAEVLDAERVLDLFLKEKGF